MGNLVSEGSQIQGSLNSSADGNPEPSLTVRKVQRLDGFHLISAAVG